MIKTIQLRGKNYSRNQWPLICTPLVGRELDDLLVQAKALVESGPDMIEWRVDFFTELAVTEKVISALKQIRLAIGDIPLLVTRRSINEGGEPISLDEAQVLDLYLQMLETGEVDAIDYEIALPDANWEQLAIACRTAGVLLIGSYHNFDLTPAEEVIFQQLERAESLGADIAKAAVMPNSKADVVTLLSVTEKADRSLHIPLITMSMAQLGLTTRLIGSVFGSCLTFAAGEAVSAPGQVPIEEVKSVVSLIQKYQQSL